jgi:hypothetical protein
VHGGLAGEPGLGVGVAAQEECGGFGEGPLEVSVADLSPAGAGALACGDLGAADEAGVGGEVLDGGEAGDVVDLVEDDEGEDLADAGTERRRRRALGSCSRAERRMKSSRRLRRSS